MGKMINIEDMKKLEFNMLKFLREICVKNNLRFYIIGGTLLGAVRHRGFIPWDDDIDVVMPREDFEKVVEIMNNSSQSRYKLFSVSNKEDYIYTFGKLIDTNTCLRENIKHNVSGLGIYLDIFPIDGLPDNTVLRKLHYFKIYILKKLLYLTYYSNFKSENIMKKTIKKILLSFADKLGERKLINSIIKIAKKYRYDNCDSIGVITAGYGIKEIMPKEIYKETVYLEFEGEKFPAPWKYKEYLTRIYGNYMELPPEEDRVTHHNYEVYWKDDEENDKENKK